jgi:hypothetical protein
MSRRVCALSIEGGATNAGRTVDSISDADDCNPKDARDQSSQIWLVLILAAGAPSDDCCDQDTITRHKLLMWNGEVKFP